MELRALTADDFRRMIGTSDYGEVRLSGQGGLEKVNNHFLQRHNIKAVKISSAESFYLANSLLKALSGQVSPATMNSIRAKLSLSLVNISEAQPLSRRVIREVFDLVDGGRQEGTALSPSRLKSLIRQSNMAIDDKGDRIVLSNGELSVLARRYGGQLVELSPRELGEAIKKILANDKLAVGERALSRVHMRTEKESDAIGSVIFRETSGCATVSCCRGKLGVKRGDKFEKLVQDEYQAAKTNILGMDFLERSKFVYDGVPITVDQCDWVEWPIGLEDFRGGKTEVETVFEELRKPETTRFDWDGVKDNGIPEFASKLIDSMLPTQAENLARNPVSGCIVNKSGTGIYSFQPYSDGSLPTQRLAEFNKDLLKAFGRQLLLENPTTTPRQLFMALKVFYQAVFAMPGHFGIYQDAKALANFFQMSFDNNDIKVSFHFKNIGEATNPSLNFKDKVVGVPPFKWEYRINPEGKLLTEYLGRDEDSLEIPKPQDIPTEIRAAVSSDKIGTAREIGAAELAKVAGEETVDEKELRRDDALGNLVLRAFNPADVMLPSLGLE